MDRSSKLQDYYDYYLQKQCLNVKSKQTIEDITGLVQFDWENKWLKGQEYSHMLNNMDQYCEKFNFQIFTKKNHPEDIYINPLNGMVYFVEGNCVGSDFGFPRLDIKKRYKWKKMNFTTDLPKKWPLVTYIVASAVKCDKFFPNAKNEGPFFRMHAVITHQDKKKQQKQYILCHIRKIDQNYKVNKNPDNCKQNLELTDIIKKKIKKSQNSGETTELEEQSTDSQNVQPSSPKSIQSFHVEQTNLKILLIQDFSRLQFLHQQNEINLDNIINKAVQMCQEKPQFSIFNQLNRKIFLDPILQSPEKPVDYRKLFNLLNSSFG